MCPYAAAGECRYGVNCAYLHGDVCDMCGLQVLHPTNNTQRSDHTKVTTATPEGEVAALWLLCTLSQSRQELYDWLSGNRKVAVSIPGLRLLAKCGGVPEQGTT